MKKRGGYRSKDIIFCGCMSIVLCFAFLADATEKISLTLKQRIQYQRAIEEVYWRNRIWPKENPNSKPSLDEVLSRVALRQKVEDYVRKSNALELYWNRPISPHQLQSEINRMIRNTKQPHLLKQLFAALNNDPYLIAECLARPTLADHLIRNWYAFDDRFHGNLKAEAETDISNSHDLREMSGEYSEREYDLAEDSDLNQWNSLQRELQLVESSSTKRAHLHQNEDSFFVYQILEDSTTHVRIAFVRWPKTPFGEWWKNVRFNFSMQLTADFGDYHLENINEETCSDDTWGPTAAPPDPRSAHSAVWTGTEMIVWGGTMGVAVFNSGGRYDPATDTWIRTSMEGAPSQRYAHTAIWTGTEMIIWGGGDGIVYFNDGGRYDPITDSWLSLSITNAPSPRRHHTAVWTGSKMLVWGGLGNFYPTDGGNYDPLSDSWTPISTVNAPSPRDGHTAVWTGSEMIIWGGWSIGGQSKTGGRYDPLNDTWIATDMTDAPAGRQDHTAIWTGSEMIVWGGDDADTFTNTGGRYNPISDSWLPTSTLSAPQGRRFHTAVWSGSEMIIWGGEVWGSGSGSTGGRYDPLLDSWSSTNTTSAPFERIYHTAIWTGSEMIIWGGWGDAIFNDGGRYDPALDSWIPTSMLNVPSGRQYHTAVWTGNEMIIWGGVREIGSCVNTGGMYVPATDTWAPTETINAPSARASHTAVWSGADMIIWGGSLCDGLINSGGRYNPAMDQWSPTTTAGSPEARYHHTSIWTGTEMIVWGGSNGFTGHELNTGGRYDPLNDSWIPTSTINPPLGRSDHTAVWTGTEMIVWGGTRRPFWLNTGGRYNPSADSWLSTSTTNAPTPRIWHTAIWTGSEMIVWGGDSNTNTGGKYDPGTDTWQPTTTVGAPMARHQHTAVWTGEEMIIWGGWNIQWTPGGRYVPAADSWRLTTMINQPTPRAEHTAVWTGSEMIVWGGEARMNSGGLYCAIAQVPIATDDSYSATEDVQLIVPIEESILANDTDPNNDTLTAVLEEQPSFGSVTLNEDGSFSYLPNPDFNGVDTFTYYASDGSYNSNTATVTITVLPVNDPPVAVADSAATPEDTTVIIEVLLNDYDVDGDNLTITTVTQPTNGSATDNGNGTLTYTPNPNFFGTDTFTYTISDGNNGFDTATVDITVMPVNDPPVAVADSATTPEDASVMIEVLMNDFDVDGDNLTITELTQPANGVATDIGNGTLIYTPNPNFFGNDTFIYTITDGNNGFSTAAVNIAVTPVNDPPVASPDSASTQENIAVTIDVLSNDSDVDGDKLTIIALTQPANGNATINGDGTITYTPNPNFYGNDVFTYTITDGNNGFDTTTVDITVTHVCLYCDDFNDGTQPNWTEIKPNCKETNGFMTCTPAKKKATIIATPAFVGCQSCVIETAVTTNGGIGSRVWLLTHYADKTNNLEVILKEETDKIVVKQRSGGSIIAKAKGDVMIDQNVSYSVQVQYDGRTVSVNVGSAPTPQITLTPIGLLPSGTIGFQSKNTIALFDYITVN